MFRKILDLIFGRKLPNLPFWYEIRPYQREIYEVKLNEGRALIPFEYGRTIEGKQELIIFAGRVRKWEDTGIAIPEEDREKLLFALEEFLKLNGRLVRRI